MSFFRGSSKLGYYCQGVLEDSYYVISKAFTVCFTPSSLSATKTLGVALKDKNPKHITIIF